MWSVCSRRRLASMAFMIHNRELPRSFWPGPIGLWNFVASSTPSVRPSSRICGKECFLARRRFHEGTGVAPLVGRTGAGPPADHHAADLDAALGAAHVAEARVAERCRDAPRAVGAHLDQQPSA